MSKNPNIVIIFPEIYLRIIWNQKVTYCHEESNRHRKISNDLAQHYGISAIVQMVHVPCQQYHNMSSLSQQQRQDIAELYLKWKYGKLDGHPNSYVHKMLAEFLLYYFFISMEMYGKGTIIENSGNKLTKESFKMPAPLYRGTVLLEKTHEFLCINLEENSSSVSFTTPSRVNSPNDHNLTLSFNNINLPTPVKCGGKNYGIIVYFIVMLCATCKQNEANVEANFTIISLPKKHEIRSQIGPIQFKFPLLHNGYQTKVLQPLIPAKNSEHELIIPGDSHAAITKSDLKIIQKKDSNYKIELIYLMIGFQCIENR